MTTTEIFLLLQGESKFSQWWFPNFFVISLNTRRSTDEADQKKKYSNIFVVLLFFQAWGVLEGEVLTKKCRPQKQYFLSHTLFKKGEKQCKKKIGVEKYFRKKGIISDENYFSPLLLLEIETPCCAAMDSDVKNI